MHYNTALTSWGGHLFLRDFDLLKRALHPPEEDPQPVAEFIQIHPFPVRLSNKKDSAAILFAQKQVFCAKSIKMGEMLLGLLAGVDWRVFIVSEEFS